MSDASPVALITGASRGIGAHLADAFGDCGYTVERSSASGGGGCTALDVTDPDAVEAYVAGVVERRGGIGVLINNAGVIDTEVDLASSDPEQWWRVVEVNVRGPYLLTRCVLPVMVAAGAGRIVNINSGASTRPGAVASAYSVSKTALARITGSTHLAGQGHGVYAFDLAPGVVRTEMTLGMPSHEGRTEWTEPAQVAELALALASGRLDAWSGRLVRVGADAPATLEHRAASGLGDHARTITLRPYGPGDPLGP